jgi:hypothetical protein
MAITKRKQPLESESSVMMSLDSEKVAGDEKQEVKPGWTTGSAPLRVAAAAAALVPLMLAAFVAATHGDHNSGLAVAASSRSSTAKTLSFADVTEVLAENLPGSVVVHLHLQQSNNLNSLGPHQVVVTHPSTCTDARVWIQLVGDSLIALDLIHDQNELQWRGRFSVPLPGTYAMHVQWHACSDGTSKSSIGYQAASALTFGNAAGDKGDAGGDDCALLTSRNLQLFPPGVWISKRAINTTQDLRSNYIWFAHHDHHAMHATPITTDAFFPVGDKAVVSKESTPIPSHFSDLSNYELVCWIGGDTAAALQQSFLALRPSVAKNQRPFKFHHYKVTDLMHGDKHWGDVSGFYKCKTILVLVDQVDEGNITQQAYKDQLTHFIKHMLQAVPDETFSIWLLTLMEPAVTPTMCTAPTMPLTLHHPCNDVIFDLVDSGIFPSRVKSFDNTDLSRPMFEGEHPNELGAKEVFATVALRTFALVGATVAAWRKMGQQGTKDGLNRNGLLEPNPKYQRHDWTVPIP